MKLISTTSFNGYADSDYRQIIKNQQKELGMMRVAFFSLMGGGLATVAAENQAKRDIVELSQKAATNIADVAKKSNIRSLLAGLGGAAAFGAYAFITTGDVMSKYYGNNNQPADKSNKTDSQIVKDSVANGVIAGVLSGACDFFMCNKNTVDKAKKAGMSLENLKKLSKKANIQTILVSIGAALAMGLGIYAFDKSQQGQKQ